MLTINGPRQTFCDGISRRNFLKIGAFGAGLSLVDLLRVRAADGKAASGSPKSCIMIWLGGGPPHLDMYDLKPNAPDGFRGEFKPIQTNVPGVDICEHFPLQAQMWDKLAVIRSLVSTDDHFDSETMTGYNETKNRVRHHPSFGAVVSKLRGGLHPQIPPFVSLRGLTGGQEPGFLGVAHRAFTPSGPGLENLKLPKDVSTARLEDRKSLLSSFDTMRRDLDATGTAAGLDEFTARAFDIVASGGVRRALDLTREDPKTRDRYRGIEQFLTARRLVEAGVGCVTLNYGGWDLHGAEFGESAHNFKACRKQLPFVDRGVANLIQDLHDRGMENDVVTVMWGEFGRSPKITPTSGRDHWPQAMSALIAGGGLKMGQAIGSTTSRAERPKERPCSVSQVLGTLYRAIGIDPSQGLIDNSGRSVCVLDDREPIPELS
ncbi:hypothetical protein AYO44_11045 [Planctomycetaceae bacterium SCGC AG-212-F19]|nr:hypothetical protein AYO44_11045 [Planctomycetaceae bacterium SCGC AG-212-F19]